MSAPLSRKRRLLEESFELALFRDQNFPRLFYEILFRDYPSTRALFVRNSPNAQRTMLSKALMAAIDHIDDWDWLVENLAPLGKQHVGYGSSLPAPLSPTKSTCSLDRAASAQARGFAWMTAGLR
ncbi:MAG TPA: hypothetical protein VGJ84_24015 [Polyangiaceae bacterium]|jgi:hypothetical protein